MEKSQDYLFNSAQRKMLMSLFDEFDAENRSSLSPHLSPLDIDDYDSDDLDDNSTIEMELDCPDSAISKSSGVNNRHGERLSGSRSKQMPSMTKTDCIEGARVATKTNSSEFSIASWCPNMMGQHQANTMPLHSVPNSKMQRTVPDVMSFSSSVQLESAVDSVSTIQATEVFKAGAKSKIRSNENCKIKETPDNKQSTVTQDGVDSGSVSQKKRRRRTKKKKLRRAQQPLSAQQEAIKTELFSQYLCSGLSADEQNENLRCLLRTTQNRSFCIRSDQRKSFTDLKLMANRREFPIRVNRTTQLRLQRLEAAKDLRVKQALHLTRHLSEDRQQKLRQQRLERKQAELRDSEKRRNAAEAARISELERSELRRRAMLQHRQRNRNAVGVSNSSMSVSRCVTMSSPSGTRTSSDSETTVSLNTVNMALDDEIEAVRRAKIFSDEDEDSSKSLRKNQPKRRLRSRNTGTTASSVSRCNEIEKVASSCSGDVASAASESVVLQELEKRQTQRCFQKQLTPQKTTESSFAQNQRESKENEQYTQQIQLQQTGDSDVLGRSISEDPPLANDLVSSKASTDLKAIALDRLRSDFLDGVEARLFDAASAAAHDDTAADSGDLTYLSEQLFAEFTALKGDLARLLGAKMQSISGDLSPSLQAEQITENQRQLNDKLQQLGSLIKRLMKHTESNGGCSSISSGCPGVSGLAGTPTAEKDKLNFAALISSDKPGKATPACSPLVDLSLAETYMACENPTPETIRHVSDEIYNTVNPFPSVDGVAIRKTPSEETPVSTDSTYSERPSTGDPDQPDETARRIIAQLRQKLDIMRRASQAIWPSQTLPQPQQSEQTLGQQRQLPCRLKSLGDPLAAMEHRRRLSRQRAVERDPSEARFFPVMFRFRKWRHDAPQFQVFTNNRSSWKKRYQDSVLPLWTNSIRADLSQLEPIEISLQLLSSRLGKPLSPEWVLSTTGFADDICPGGGAVLNLRLTPEKAGLRPWQTIFVSETNFTRQLASIPARTVGEIGRAGLPRSDILKRPAVGQQVLQGQPAQLQALDTGTLQAALASAQRTLTATLPSSEKAAELSVKSDDLEKCPMPMLSSNPGSVYDAPSVLAKSAVSEEKSDDCVTSVVKSILSTSCASCRQCACQQQQQHQTQLPEQHQQLKQQRRSPMKGDIYSDSLRFSSDSLAISNSMLGHRMLSADRSGDSKHFLIGNQPIPAKRSSLRRESRGHASHFEVNEFSTNRSEQLQQSFQSNVLTTSMRQFDSADDTLTSSCSRQQQQPGLGIYSISSSTCRVGTNATSVVSIQSSART